jgi:hypothetical protein
MFDRGNWLSVKNQVSCLKHFLQILQNLEFIYVKFLLLVIVSVFIEFIEGTRWNLVWGSDSPTVSFERNPRHLR